MKKQKNFKNQKGITLVALIITIIVLVILAAVAINVALNTGIINFATKGVKDYAEAGVEENRVMNKAIDFMESTTKKIEGILGENGGTGGTSSGEGSNPKPNPGTSEKPTTIPEAIEQEYEFTENTPLKDEFDNPVTIPAGFHIVTKTEDPTVEYDYSDSGIPTVQDGIVVADEAKNQFVWIPTGTIKNKSDDKNGPTTEIKLARYTFNITIDEDSYEITGGTGEVKTTIEDGLALTDEVTNIWYSDEITFTEDTNGGTGKSSYGNAIAKDIDAFKESASSKETGGNGGYYLARYEASQGTDDKVKSKGNVAPWYGINQLTASEKAGAMYASENYTSDLTNSYAWDTAIVFIQKYADSDYSMLTSRNSGISPSTTGEGNDRTSSVDKVCNIYDMASNCLEWTTETCMKPNSPCVARGGNFGGGIGFAAFRYHYNTYRGESFRPILYVNLLAE